MTKPSYNQLIGTLRVAGGLIQDALPTAQGTAAEALAHAYEAIETTLVGVTDKLLLRYLSSEPKPLHEREPPHCASCSCGMTAVEPTVTVPLIPPGGTLAETENHARKIIEDAGLSYGGTIEPSQELEVVEKCSECGDQLMLPRGVEIHSWTCRRGHHHPL